MNMIIPTPPVQRLSESFPLKRYVLAGSYPLQIRKSKDIDLIAYRKDVEEAFPHFNISNDYIHSTEYDGRRYEFLFADKMPTFQKIMEEAEKDGYKTTYEILYLIKSGHIKVNPTMNAEKHINDLHILKRILNEYEGKTSPYPIRRNLIKEIEKDHVAMLAARNQRSAAGKLNLKQDTNRFFKDNVQRYIEHDDIHLFYKKYDVPMYKKIQEEGSQVLCSKKLWNKLSFEDKINTVHEESYVIATERILIPDFLHKRKSPDQGSAYLAFKYAISRISTNLTKGFFRDFAFENYYLIVNSFDEKYYEKFFIEENIRIIQENKNKNEAEGPRNRMSRHEV